MTPIYGHGSGQYIGLNFCRSFDVSGLPTGLDGWAGWGWAGLAFCEKAGKVIAKMKKLGKLGVIAITLWRCCRKL